MAVECPAVPQPRRSLRSRLRLRLRESRGLRPSGDRPRPRLTSPDRPGIIIVTVIIVALIITVIIVASIESKTIVEHCCHLCHFRQELLRIGHHGSLARVREPTPSFGWPGLGRGLQFCGERRGCFWRGRP